MVPESGLSRPSISFKMVDFPAPLAPRKIFVCPARTSKVMSFRIDLVVERQADLVEQHDGCMPFDELDGQAEFGE